MAATSDPKCSGPEGEGAKRPRYGPLADAGAPCSCTAGVQRAEMLEAVWTTLIDVPG